MLVLASMMVSFLSSHTIAWICVGKNKLREGCANTAAYPL
jgi:hypothetical protein